MIAEEALGDSRPRAVVAAHVHPELPWGSVALDAGAVNASCDAIEIEIAGETTHGAYPHLGRDPVLALSEVVVALHAAAGRRVDPLHPATLTIGVLEAGSAENVIPATALARGALRAHREQDRELLRELSREVVAGVAAAHGCQGIVRLTPGEPRAAQRPRDRRAGARAARRRRTAARSAVALVRIGRLLLLRRARPAGDGVRRARRGAGLPRASAAPSRAAATR